MNFDEEFGWLTHYELTGEEEFRMHSSWWVPRKRSRSTRADYDQSHRPDPRWNADAVWTPTGLGFPVCYAISGREITPKVVDYEGYE